MENRVEPNVKVTKFSVSSLKLSAYDFLLEKSRATQAQRKRVHFLT